MMTPIALLSLLCMSALLGIASVKRIPEGHVYTLRRIGRAAPRLLKPGTHVVWPLIERIVHRISLSGHTLPLELQLPEGQPRRRASGTVYWQVLEPERADAVIEHVDDIIREETLAHLRVSSTDEDARALNTRLKQALNARLRDRGLLATRVDMHLA